MQIQMIDDTQLGSFNGSSEMPSWSANNNNVLKAFMFVSSPREEEKWHEHQTDNGSCRW